MLLSLFGKLFSKKELINFSVLKTDMHSHLIPGIDDGSKDLATTKKMLEGLKHLGFSKWITTPHIMPHIFNNNEQSIIENGAVMNENLDEHITIAAEYYIDEDFVAKIKSEQPLLTFGDNYILIEVSMGVKEKLLEEVIFELTTRNIKPILAHAERYPYMYANNSLDYYDTLRNADVLLQVNLRSFLGHYGEIQKKIARKLATEHMIDFLGTDMHNELQIPMLEEAMADDYVQALLKSGTLKNHLL